VFKLKSDTVLFCDVDDSLVTWNADRSAYTIHKRHVAFVEGFFARGLPVIVWSLGGWKWASKIVKELGWEHKVTAVLSKPRWYLDDKPASEWMPEANRIYLEDYASDVTLITNHKKVV
jgi:hypothetical protein